MLNRHGVASLNKNDLNHLTQELYFHASYLHRILSDCAGKKCRARQKEQSYGMHHGVPEHGKSGNGELWLG